MPLGEHQFIDNYEILALVGAGGMGEVYRAADLRLNREVAIKVLPGFTKPEPERLRRFEQEARAAAALNHPNILAVYQMGIFEDAPYLVSELLEGETLRDRLKRGPLPLRKVIDYGIQIAKGLAAAHDKGIVHRDLKPENLFLTKDGRVKILDFGLARLTQPKLATLSHSPQDVQTIPGMMMGSMGYMSPEQVRGGVTDQRSDIFTFAAVLYEMLTGQRAFQKATSIDAMSAILNEEPPPITQVNPSLPLPLERVVQRGLEKNPEQRFQSASDLGFALEAMSDAAHSTFTSSRRLPSMQPTRARKPLILAASSLVVVAGAVFAWLWMRPVAQPQVANYLQLTHDGTPKYLIGTDGSRIFLTFGDSGMGGPAAIPISGGEATRIAMPNSDMLPVDLTPDGSSFLIVEGSGFPATGPLWTLPVMGGSPRRVGDATGHVAAWSADGKHIAYAKDRDVVWAEADGSNARKIAAMKNIVSGLAISPDDADVQVETEEISQSGTSVVAGERTIWVVSTKESTPRPLIADWPSTLNECCGKWTGDGRNFVFESGGQIWALPVGGGLFRRNAKPVQLTSSPMQLQSPLPSKDGKKLFVVGMTFRGELTSFDPKTGKASLFLNGISADWMEVSRDGKQVVYVSYPQGDLWKSNIDGTNRVQLTFGPIRPVLPRWSPDGQTIMFFDFPVGSDHPGKIYDIPATGGAPRELLPSDTQNEQDPTWSADGKRVAFGVDANNASAMSGPAIRILEVQSGKVTTVPGSEKMFSPRWSPDGRYLAAMTSDSTHLMLLEFQTQKWKEIGKGTMSWINWSRDSQYVYFKDMTDSGAVERIQVSDGKAEKILDLKDSVFTGLGGGSVSVGPDGSALLLRDRGTQDVYALDWIEP
jgi:eukaryotic-like serine/threonine-protein kinase